MPGPLAAQLAIYLGYVHYGIRFKKLPEPLVVLVAALIGLLLYPVRG